jgi:hemerythrin-like domain-containing protein
LGEQSVTRRRWIAGTTAAGIVAAGGGLIVAQGRSAANRSAPPAEPIPPNERLMREHGVLDRLMLIYRDAISRIDNGKPIPPDTLSASAKLIHNFIESYHQRLEEEYIFPRFRKANKMIDVINTLQLQHQRGRALTQRIIGLSNASGVRDTSQRARLKQYMHLYVRMFEPHQAREDTLIFPAFRNLISSGDYDALGQQFESVARQAFGANTFDKHVDLVGRLEKEVGLYELAEFTPPANFG